MKESIAQGNEKTIERQLQQKGIKWVLQPPASPHMSRVWQRLVQTTQKHLKNVVGDGLLNDLELRTLLAENESIVNNRPITAVPDDPADFTALTPNLFLVQRVTQIPPGVFVREDKFPRRRWRKVQFHVDHYWKRVPTWRLNSEDNVVRNRCPLGRVVEVFTRQDGGVRSARIKTADGVFQRPITRYASWRKLVMTSNQ